MKVKVYCLLVLGVMLGLGVSVSADWPMSGHDLQRTSWASEDEVGVCTNPVWHKRCPWIPSRSHIITAEGFGGAPDLVFVPTADGIYALNPDDGSDVWFYAMDPPPGDSPAVAGSVMYVGGTDHTIHAVDILTGNKIWQTYMAGGPFYCNPLVVNNKVYAGSRDGYFYCFDANDGSYLWSYKTDWPIAMSAAYQTYTDYPNGVVFFATRGNYAYALRADTGELIWKSQQFNAESLSAFWPVVVEDGVIFVSNSNFFDTHLNQTCLINALYPQGEAASHVDANGWLDLQNHVDYLVQNPKHNTFFVLDYKTGLEAEISPIFYQGNCGVRYPPSIGSNPVGSGNLVWAMTTWESSWQNHGRYAGWQMGTGKVRPVPSISNGAEAGDEPEAQSIIGSNHLYYNRGGDGVDAGGAFYLSGGGGDLWNCGEFESAFGNYNEGWADRRYGNATGYGMEGYQNPPVPLKGKVYFHRSSAVICVGP